MDKSHSSGNKRAVDPNAYVRCISTRRYIQVSEMEGWERPLLEVSMSDLLEGPGMVDLDFKCPWKMRHVASLLR